MSSPLFGIAGCSDSYKAQGYKNMLQIALYVAEFGLNAFEYQAGHGVRLTDENADALRENGCKANVVYSIHAPYYISMSSMNEEKRLNSLRYILQSADAVRRLGGTRVIFHAGSCGQQSRETALTKALDTMARMQNMLDEEGFSDIILCPETMGKIGQLGTLEEVIALCMADKRTTPCIDFGHLNARSKGGVATKNDYACILDYIAEKLCDERAKKFHVHFSHIEYGEGGEKRHLTFADDVFGPVHEPFLELCCERGLAPTIICESAGTQTEDARAMREYYASLRK